mmetsp:Transcript_73151/g.118681  ORF Transcript_73151/g.118681 Transcript_73151/m.118681 type:complete len:214 (-) Transcript_73151:31-672(-)
MCKNLVQAFYCLETPRTQDCCKILLSPRAFWPTISAARTLLVQNFLRRSPPRGLSPAAGSRRTCRSPMDLSAHNPHRRAHLPAFDLSRQRRRLDRSLRPASRYRSACTGPETQTCRVGSAHCTPLPAPLVRRPKTQLEISSGPARHRKKPHLLPLRLSAQPMTVSQLCTASTSPKCYAARAARMHSSRTPAPSLRPLHHNSAFSRVPWESTEN